MRLRRSLGRDASRLGLGGLLSTIVGVVGAGFGGSVPPAGGREGGGSLALPGVMPGTVPGLAPDAAADAGAVC